MATHQTSPIPKALFSLDTTTPPACITVNGQPYDLLRGDQLSIAQYHEAMRLIPRYDALMQAESLDEAQSEELAQVLVRLCRLVLLAPDEVQIRLNDNQRLQVVLAFTALSLLTPGPRARATTTAPPVRRSTGASRSRASAGSTRAPRRRRG